MPEFQPLRLFAVCGSREVNCTVDDPVDPDVAGVGVLISNLLMTAVTLITIIWAYVSYGLEENRYNYFDHRILNAIEGAIPMLKGNRRKLAAHPELQRARVEGFEKFILSLSDQQLITGCVSLIALYFRICDVSVFSFRVTTALAYLSAFVHQATLTILRGYFDKHKELRNLRVAVMILFFGLMLASLILTGVGLSDATSDDLAICAIHEGPVAYTDDRIDPITLYQAIVVTTFLGLVLSVAHLKRVVEVFSRSVRQSNSPVWYWALLGRAFPRCAPASIPNLTATEIARIRDLLTRGRRGSYNIMKAKRVIHMHLERLQYRSFSNEISWLFFYSTFGFSNISIVPAHSDVDVDSLMSMGYGQLLALLLLTLPLFQAVESYFEIKRIKTRLHATSHNSRRTHERADSTLPSNEVEQVTDNRAAESEQPASNGDSNSVNSSAPLQHGVLRRRTTLAIVEEGPQAGSEDESPEYSLFALAKQGSLSVFGIFWTLTVLGFAVREFYALIFAGIIDRAPLDMLEYLTIFAVGAMFAFFEFYIPVLVVLSSIASGLTKDLLE